MKYPTQSFIWYHSPKLTIIDCLDLNHRSVTCYFWVGYGLVQRSEPENDLKSGKNEWWYKSIYYSYSYIYSYRLIVIWDFLPPWTYCYLSLSILYIPCTSLVNPFLFLVTLQSIVMTDERRIVLYSQIFKLLPYGLHSLFVFLSLLCLSSKSASLVWFLRLALDFFNRRQ